MVCLGNICRSPMAEGVMRQKIDKFGLSAEVNSKGTANYHIGEAPDSRATQTLLKYGIDISKHQGQQFTVSDFDTYDLIFAMDLSNFDNIISLARNAKDKTKVNLMMDESFPNKQKIVPDPYYGNLQDFEETYNLLNHACEDLAKRLVKM